MTIKLRWLDIANHPVLVYEFHTGWTWADFYIVKQRADTLLESSSVKIPLIFDFHHAPDMPPGMLKQTRNIAETRHLNGSPVIIVGASNIVQTTFNIVKRMIGNLPGDLMDDIEFVSDWDKIPAFLTPYVRE